MIEQASNPSVRVDVWLWSVRVVKTRAAAATAARGGHVRVNAVTAKPSTRVRVGDDVRIRLQGFDRILTVTGLVSKRVGAPVAVTCYCDHTPERPKPLVPPVPVRERGAGRPTKKDRRELDRLRRGFTS